MKEISFAFLIADAGLFHSMQETGFPVFVDQIEQTVMAGHHGGQKLCAQATDGIAFLIVVPFQQKPASGKGVVYGTPNAVRVRQILGKFLLELTTIVDQSQKISRLFQSNTRKMGSGNRCRIMAVLSRSLDNRVILTTANMRRK